MANIPFKSITFPGLPNKYTVPEISNDLMTAGKAADAKATGDALSALEDAVTEETDKLKADLEALDAQVDDLRSAIDNIDGSLSATAIQLLDTILTAAVYTSDQTVNIRALIEELSSSGNADNITVENGVMNILGLANTPTLSNGILSIA